MRYLSKPFDESTAVYAGVKEASIREIGTSTIRNQPPRQYQNGNDLTAGFHQILQVLPGVGIFRSFAMLPS